MSRERMDATARAYVATFREHMRIEEKEILPLAKRLLAAADWTAVDKAIRQLQDPLFGVRAEQRYAALARHIDRT